MKPIVIITAPAHPYLAQRLQDRGFDVVMSETITYNELSNTIALATGLVVSTRIKIDQPLLEKAVTLKWIARLGSGMELIDTTFAATKNIVCVSSPEGNAGAVGEHAMALLLNLMNKVSASFLEEKNGLWIRDGNRADAVMGTTVVIIGMGQTGNAFARRLQVQERLTTQIRDCIQDTLNPLGVAVVIEAKHLCMQMRGVQKQNSVTTTSAFTGEFLIDKTRSEFINLISSRLH